MSVGKYSPTVQAAYTNNQGWWKAASEYGSYDAEGYDAYGYNEKGYDRAGNHENDYLSCGQDVEFFNTRTDAWETEWRYPFYESVWDDWTCSKETGLPVKRS